MASIRLEVELPEEFVCAIGGPREELPERVTELLAVELCREGALTIPRAAQALRLSVEDFITLLNRRRGLAPEQEEAAQFRALDELEEQLVREQGHGGHMVIDIPPDQLAEVGRIFRERRKRLRASAPGRKS